MALDAEAVRHLAEHLEGCELAAQDTVKITDEYPDLTWPEAYQIQDEIRRRKEERGHRISGLKMGLTSIAKMKQMGVNEPICGFLADYMALPDGAEVDTSKLIHPKVEAEVGFMIRDELKGPGVHVGDVLRATEFVAPCIEVIDSRYRDFKFDLPSVIADNTSASRYVVGSVARAIDEVDVRTMGVVMEKNGQVVQLGAGAAVLGHPAISVAALANMLHARGKSIPAGTFVMTGGVTAAVLVEQGDCITTRFQDLGSITLKFV